MENLLISGINNERNQDFNFYIEGDLSQMSAQRTFLNNRGIKTKQNNVYPCLRESDVKTALKLIWNNNVEGWWHYKESYVKHGICTAEEFKTKLHRS